MVVFNIFSVVLLRRRMKGNTRCRARYLLFVFIVVCLYVILDLRLNVTTTTRDFGVDIYKRNSLKLSNITLIRMSKRGQDTESTNVTIVSLNDAMNTVYERVFYRVDTTPEETVKLPFLPNYKNPCWREALWVGTNKTIIRCLPYFYLIGATKCGTTDLHHRMKLHPLISSRVPKELHWMSLIRFGKKGSNLSMYLNRFNRGVEDMTSAEHQENGHHNMIFGDGTPNTIWETKRYWTPHNTTEPARTNADVIHGLYPGTKIIATLRDPVTRAYSNYKYTTKSPTPELFHQKMVKCIQIMETCLKTRSLRNCIDKFPSSISDRRTFIGIYYIFLEDFFRVFPKNQILIVKSEDTLKDVSGTIKKVFDFLEIGQPQEAVWKRIMASPKRNVNIKRSGLPMLNETRIILKNFFEPYNKKLALLLGEHFNYNSP